MINWSVLWGLVRVKKVNTVLKTFTRAPLTLEPAWNNLRYLSYYPSFPPFVLNITLIENKAKVVLKLAESYYFFFL